ncbi:hypothetical protein ACFLZ5_00925 [Thermodesulfobacteriota bacterium]
MAENMGKNRGMLFFLFAAILLMILPISSDSLWIDEGVTAWFASQGTFKDLLDALKTTSMAESLMPGYVIYMWVWVKAFGISEYSLRLSNLPFIITVLFLFTKIPLNRVFKNTLILLTVFSPFLWFYMNEARSYISLFSFSTTSIVGLLFYFYGESKLQKIGPYLTLLSLLIGSFFNISLGFVVFALIPTAFFIYRETKNKREYYLIDWKIPIIFSIPFFVVLGSYFYMTVAAGSGGRLQEGTGGPIFKHVVFCFYEFLGFAGLGPPRIFIREYPSFSTFTSYMPLLCTAAALMSFILFYIIISYKKNDMSSRLLKNSYLCGFLAGFLSFFIFALAKNFTFYGRHVIFLYPFFIFAITYMVNEIWEKKYLLMLRYVLIASLLLILLVSGLQLRFSPKYFKDDYRAAVSGALLLGDNDDPIFWAADPYTGAYYGLEFYDTDFKWPFKIKTVRKVYYAANWSIKKISERIGSIESYILVLSKNDLYDRMNGWSTFISAHPPAKKTNYNAFNVYKFER